MIVSGGLANSMLRAQFERGAVTVLDVVGHFPVRTGYADDELESLADLALACEEISYDFEAAWRASFPDLAAGIRAFSYADSIVLSLSFSPSNAKGMDINVLELDLFCLGVICSAVIKLIQRGAELNPPLSLRGAVAFGSIMLRNSSLIGPAVEEAASNATLPDAAVVYLAPSAEEVMETTRSDQTLRQIYEDVIGPDRVFAVYEFRLVGGKHRGTVLNPFGGPSALSEREIENLELSILKGVRSRKLLAGGKNYKKYNNTVDFLRKMRSFMSDKGTKHLINEQIAESSARTVSEQKRDDKSIE